jgi:hypothetical protein
MSREAAVIVGAIIVVFAIFTGVLSWAGGQTRGVKRR